MDKIFKSFKKAASEHISSAADEHDFRHCTRGFTLDGGCSGGAHHAPGAASAGHASAGRAPSTASGGHCLMWKCYPATRDISKEKVTLHVLTKKPLEDAIGKQHAAEIIERMKQGVHQQARIIHPGTLRVKEALREKGQYLMYATEPVQCSLANAMAEYTNVDAVSDSLKGCFRDMPELEKQFGLYQVAESLSFLHGTAGVAHLNVTPSSVYITQEGDWKVGGFDFAVHKDGSREICKNFKAFQGSDAFNTSVNPLLGPDLSYAAPEYARDMRPNYCSDAFSLGCVVYEVLASKPTPSGGVQRDQLLPCNSDVSVYNGRISQMQGRLFEEAGTAAGLVRALTTSQDRLVKTVSQLVLGTPISSDVAIKCLVYLERLPEKTEAAKLAFLKDLYATVSGGRFGRRLIVSKILPSLIPELDSLSVQYVLPILLLTVQGLSPSDFTEVLLPALSGYFKACATPTPTGIAPDAAVRNTISAILLERLMDVAKKCRAEDVKSLVIPFVCQNLSGNATLGLFAVISSLCSHGSIDRETLNSVLLPKLAHAARSHPDAALRRAALQGLADLRPQTQPITFADVIFPVLRTVLQGEPNADNLAALRGYFTSQPAAGAAGGGPSRPLGETLFTTPVVTEVVLPQLTGLLNTPEGSQEDLRFDTAHAVCLAMLGQAKQNREARKDASLRLERSGGSGGLNASGSLRSNNAADLQAQASFGGSSANSGWQADLPLETASRSGAAGHLSNASTPSVQSVPGPDITPGFQMSPFASPPVGAVQGVPAASGVGLGKPALGVGVGGGGGGGGVGAVWHPPGGGGGGVAGGMPAAGRPAAVGVPGGVAGGGAAPVQKGITSVDDLFS